MVVAKVAEFLAQWQLHSGSGLNDAADAISSTWTVAVTTALMTLVTMKTYVLTPITCHSPITYSGFNLASFVDSYCWVEGTVAIDERSVVENFPNNDREWKAFAKRGKLTYYPWVPLFLGGLGLVPFLISSAWKVFRHRGAGGDLQAVLDLALDAQTQPRSERCKAVDRIAGRIVDSLGAGRAQEEEEEERGSGRFRRLSAGLGCGRLRRRLGSPLHLGHLLTKLAFLAAHLGALVAIRRFLGLGPGYSWLGVRLLADLVAGQSWHHTGVFPRVAFCEVPVRHTRRSIIYAQCALPANMLNEVVFVLLWCWHLAALVPALLSLLLWLYRAASRPDQLRFLRRRLALAGVARRDHQAALFAKRCLRHDGLFLLRALDAAGAGRVATEVLGELWRRFEKTDSAGPARPFRDSERAARNQNTVIQIETSLV